MFFKSFKITKKLKWIFPITFSVTLILVAAISFYQVSSFPVSATINGLVNNENMVDNTENSENVEETKKDYIKWFEFNVSYDVLDKTYKLDINSHKNNEDVKYNWIELIAYLACKCGNDFSKFKQSQLDTLVQELKSGKTMEELTQNMKLYSYYFAGYDTVLHEFIGNYQVEIISSKINNKSSNVNNSIDNNNLEIIENSENQMPEKQFEEKYGLKAFSPIAKNYSYSHYDDFGNSRSYGYKRVHLGNDLMGSIGTPIIAVESGLVEALRLESVWWLENWYSQL